MIHYHLTLFIAGNGMNSQIARKNLIELRDGELAGRCTMEIVDVLENFAAAVKHNILVTPTMLISTPLNTVMIVGNLNDREKVRVALQSSMVES
ncbi:circadian clock KaiB family protein [Desulfonatronum thiosulfatophilum]|nr:circadian clock KaiB family protein [Desulfonatronum thiosulfatophilum]